MSKDFVDVYGFLCGTRNPVTDASHLIKRLEGWEQSGVVKGLWLPIKSGILPLDKSEQPNTEYLRIIPDTSEKIRKYAEGKRGTPNDHLFLARAELINPHGFEIEQARLLEYLEMNPNLYRTFQIELSSEAIPNG